MTVLKPVLDFKKIHLKPQYITLNEYSYKISICAVCWCLHINPYVSSMYASQDITGKQ